MGIFSLSQKLIFKESQVETLFLQIRKITCHHCNEPFAYILAKKGRTTQVNIRFLESDDSDLSHHMNKRATKLATKRNLGEALCPHCKRYQNWMVTKSRLSFLVRSWPLMFFVSTVILSLVLEGRQFFSTFGLAAILVLPTILSLLLAILLSIGSGVHEEKDNRSKDDNRFTKLMDECKISKADPVEVWYFHHMGEELGENQVSASMGIVDLTKHHPENSHQK